MSWLCNLDGTLVAYENRSGRTWRVRFPRVSFDAAAS